MPQALADELGRIPLSRSLAASIVRAKDHAKAKGHRLVTLEHLLLALAEDEEAALVLAACNIDLGRLGADVAGHLGRLERDPPGGLGQPPVAPELKRIIEYAAAAAQQGNRTQVDGAIVLAAMVGEGRSMAAGFLRAQELTFEAVVHALQQQAQVRAAASAAQQNGAVPPSTEEILASARERIAAGRGPGGPAAPPARPRQQPEPESRRPARQDAGLGDRAQPPPPVFADRPTEIPVRGARAADEAVASVAEASPQAPDHGPPQGDAKAEVGAASQTSEQTPGQVPAHLPPPLPQPDERNESAADAPPPRPEPDPGSADGQPPLPDWMKARQINAEQASAGGRPPPPPVRDEPVPAGPGARSLRSALDGVHGEVERLGAEHAVAASPALDAPPRRVAAAPRRLPRLDQKPAVESGQLVENIPRRMRVGVTREVEVRVGRAEADLTGNLQAGGPPTRHDLYITKAMSVRLRAPDGGMRIDTASPETQWTEATMGTLSSDFAVWRFSVTPLRRGETVLQLVVAARVLARDGIMAETALPERVINVRVRANYVRATLRASGWLAALAVGGVIGRMGEDALAYALKLINSSLGTAG